MSFPLYNSKKNAISEVKKMEATNEMMYIATDGKAGYHNNAYFVGKVKDTVGFLQGSKNRNKIMYANTGMEKPASAQKAKNDLGRIGVTVLSVERVPNLKPAEVRRLAKPYTKFFKKDAQTKIKKSLGCKVGQTWVKGKCKRIVK